MKYTLTQEIKIKHFFLQIECELNAIYISDSYSSTFKMAINFCTFVKPRDEVLHHAIPCTPSKCFDH